MKSFIGGYNARLQQNSARRGLVAKWEKEGSAKSFYSRVLSENAKGFSSLIMEERSSRLLEIESFSKSISGNVKLGMRDSKIADKSRERNRFELNSSSNNYLLSLDDKDKLLFTLMESVYDLVVRFEDSQEKKDILKIYFFNIRGLLRDGANSNLIINDSFTLFLASCVAGDVEMIEFLAKNDVDIDVVDSMGRSPLHCAVMSKNSLAVLSVLKAMEKNKRVSFSARINWQDKHGNTALHEAVNVQTDDNIVRMLVAAGANYKIRNSEQNTSFELAIENISRYIGKANTKGSSELALSYEKKGRVIDGYNLRAIGSLSDFSYSVESGLDEMLMKLGNYFLVRLGQENISAIESKLVERCIKEDMDRILSFARGNSDQVENNKVTTNLLSKSLGWNYGAIRSLANSNLSATKFDIIKSDVRQIMDFSMRLVRQGGNVNVVSVDGFSMLQLAVFENITDVVFDLLDRGADPALSGSTGQNSLHIAVKKGFLEVARRILEKHPELIDVVNEREGKAAINYARNNQEMLDLLKSKGAKDHVECNPEKGINSVLQGIYAASQANKKSDTLIKNLPQPLNISGNKGKKLKKEVLPASTKTLSERLQEVMGDLQAKASLNVVKKGENSQLELMLDLIDKSESDINVTTTNGWTVLHLAARFGELSVVESLIKRGADINAVTNVLSSSSKKVSGELTALRCAIESDNVQVIRSIISHSEIDLKVVSQEIAKSSNNRKLQDCIFGDKITKEALIDRMSLLSGKERSDLMVIMRSSVNKNSTKDFRSKVSDLEVSANKLFKSREKEKNAESIRKNKKIKARQDQVFQVVGDFKSTLSNISNIAREDALKAVEEISLEVGMVKKAVSQVVDDAILEIQSRGLKIEEICLQKKQVQDFLEGPRYLDSLEELPEFIQEIIKRSLADSHAALVKGSAAYKTSNKNKRIPGDLDLEFWIDDLSKLSDEEIIELIRDRFSPDGEIIITRFDKRREPNFSISVKDSKRGLDISIYDPNNPPSAHLDWLTSKDKKVLFNKDGTTKKDIRTSKGLCDYLVNQENLDLEQGFFVNIAARDLMTRLCFMASVGHITKEDLHSARPIPLDVYFNPTQLLYEELGFAKRSGNASPKKMHENAENKIFKIFESHDLDQEHQLKFLSIISEISEQDQSKFYSPMCEAINAVTRKVESEKIEYPNSPGKVSAFSLQRQKSADVQSVL